LHTVAEDSRQQGDLEAARRAVDEALDIARAHGSTMQTKCLQDSGELALREGDLERARRELAEAIVRALELGWPDELCYDLLIYAVVAARRDEPELAATLLGAVEARWERNGLRDDGPYGYADQAREQAHTALGEAGFAASFDAGSRPSRAEAR